MSTEPFDPNGHSVADVRAYLEAADDAERDRVLQLERDGKARKTVLGDPDEPGTPLYDETNAHVRPARYASEPGWVVGAPAPTQLVRAFDAHGRLGKAREGDLKPGERGVIVARKGDTVTRGILAARG